MLGLLALMLFQDFRRAARTDSTGDLVTLEDQDRTIEASRALSGYHLLPATRADLLRRLGRHGAAARSYREALALATTDAERRYLARRLADAENQA